MRSIWWLLLGQFCLFWAESKSENNTCKHSSLGIVTHERKLFDCLMKDYNPQVRPALNVTDTVTIHLDLFFTLIHGLDAHTSTMRSTVWMLQEWTDFQLSWNPADYGNVDAIRMPIEKLWNPFITVFNSVEKVEHLSGDHAVVHSNGTVSWLPHASLESHCNLDLTYFPYDKQSCKLFLGTWDYTGDKVDVRIVDHRNGKILYGGREWKVVGPRAEKHTKYFGTDYPYLQFTLTLTRVPSFYSYMFVGPSAAVAIATLFLFLLPPGREERLIMCSTLLLAVILLLMLLATYLPTSLGNIPVVAVYLAFDMALLLVLEILSILMLNFLQKESRKNQVPHWLRTMVLGRLGRLVCVRVPPYTSVPIVQEGEELAAERELRESFSQDTAPIPSSPTLALEKTLEDIRRYLRYLAAKTESPKPSSSHQEIIVNEWQQVMLVVDRLMFVFFLIITVIMSVACYATHH